MSEVLYCEKCNVDVEEGQKVCSGCGLEFEWHDSSEERPWYHSTGWLVFWCIIFWPVGIYGLFKRGFLPHIVGTFIVISILASAFGTKKEQEAVVGLANNVDINEVLPAPEKVKYWPDYDDSKVICTYLSLPAMAALHADSREHSKSEIETMVQNTQGFLAGKIPEIEYVDWYQPVAHKLVVETIYDNRLSQGFVNMRQGSLEQARIGFVSHCLKAIKPIS